MSACWGWISVLLLISPVTLHKLLNLILGFLICRKVTTISTHRVDLEIKWDDACKAIRTMQVLHKRGLPHHCHQPRGRPLLWDTGESLTLKESRVEGRCSLLPWNYLPVACFDFSCSLLWLFFQIKRGLKSQENSLPFSLGRLGWKQVLSQRETQPRGISLAIP